MFCFRVQLSCWASYWISKGMGWQENNVRLNQLYNLKIYNKPKGGDRGVDLIDSRVSKY